MNLQVCRASIRRGVASQGPRSNELQDPCYDKSLVFSYKRNALLAVLLFASCGQDQPREGFLSENGRRESVITTQSGLQYEVIEEGDGAKPTARDKVTVHYKGELTDGTVFDSSYERGEPTTFPVNRVIPGWTEGLQLMRVGSKYKFYIPPDLGYGSRGQGPIPPNSPLIFQVELLRIGG